MPDPCYEISFNSPPAIDAVKGCSSNQADCTE